MNDLDQFIQWAEKRGWLVGRARNNHLRMTKDGCPIVFGSATPGDWRAIRNMRAKLMRADRAMATRPNGTKP